MLALDILEQVEDVPANHRHHLELVVAEGAAREVLHDQLRRLVGPAAPQGLDTIAHSALVEIFEIKAEDVPARDDVGVNLCKILTEPLEQLPFGREALTVVPVRLLEAQAPAKHGRVGSKLPRGHTNLKDDVTEDGRARERPGRRVTLDIKRHDFERSNLVTVDERAELISPDIDVAPGVELSLTIINLDPARASAARHVHEAQDRVDVRLVHGPVVALETPRRPSQRLVGRERQLEKSPRLAILKPPQILGEDRLNLCVPDLWHTVSRLGKEIWAEIGGGGDRPAVSRPAVCTDYVPAVFCIMTFPSDSLKLNHLREIAHVASKHMWVTWFKTCYMCGAPLSPTVKVSTLEEFERVCIWSCICPLDTSRNTMFYRILGPDRMVRTCFDCFHWRPSFQKILKKEFLKNFQQRRSRAVTHAELYRWAERLVAYFKKPGEAIDYCEARKQWRESRGSTRPGDPPCPLIQFGAQTFY